MSDTAEALRHLAARLVDRSEAVEVAEVTRERGPRLELRVDPEDLGKVIGKQGRTAEALRTLLAARTSRQGGPDELKILED